MRHSISWRVLLIVALAAGVLLPTDTVFGEGEVEWRFLEGLREKNYHDIVLEYLEQVATNPQCPPDLKEVIDYESGVELVSQARTIGTLEIREKYLDQARDRFRKFLKENPRHKLVTDAGTQLANVLVERGRMKSEMAKLPSKSPEEKKALLAEARAKYEEAFVAFTAAERRAYEWVKTFEGKTFDPRKEADKIEQRNQARGDLVQARLYLASVVYEIGKSHPKGSAEYKAKLIDAAKRYADLFEKFGSLLGGLYARMWEGRTYKELGQTKKAIDIFNEMLTLPDDPEAFHMLKVQSAVLLAETLIQPGQKKYQEAIDLVDKWEKTARGNEESSDEGLNLHFLGGKSAFELAKTLSTKEQQPARKAALKTAKTHLQFVTRFQSEHRRNASQILNDPLFGSTSDDEAKPPKNYTEAKDRGDFAWGGLVVAISEQARAKTPEAKASAAKALEVARDKAIKNYQYTLALKTRDVSIDELNLIRFRMTYLYWADQDHCRATVMGEFLAREYPEAVGARKGAEIAIKGYRTLYSQAAKIEESCDFEKRRMASLAEYMTSRWADGPEAEEAWLMLIDTAVDERELDKAIEYLDKISENSQKRIQAELRTGQALWGAYVAAVNAPEDERPSAKMREEMVLKAQTVLEQGIARMMKNVESGDEVTYSMVYSVLVLTQVYLGNGQAEEAVRWLDDPKIGPMTLIRANAQVTNRATFKTDTYKAGLRAYVGVQQLDKAEESMNALEKLIAADGDASAVRKLTQEYIRLGRELEDLLTRLRKEGKNDEAAKVSNGFKVFLARISGREEGNTYGSLNWVAQTFLGLGSGIDPGGKDPPKEAIEFYDKARETYGDIYKRIKKDPAFAPSGSSATVIIRLANCWKALHEHEKAMTLLEIVLRQNEKRLDVQIEAAETYQDWGLQNADSYKKAIFGGRRKAGDDHNPVWGWSVISKRVAPFEKFRSIFHQSRYNLALCHKNMAKAKTGTEAVELYKQAELDIVRIHALYPKMGGEPKPGEENWRPKYDALLKDIQRALRKKPTGLKSLDGDTSQ